MLLSKPEKCKDKQTLLLLTLAQLEVNFVFLQEKMFCTVLIHQKVLKMKLLYGLKKASLHNINHLRKTGCTKNEHLLKFEAEIINYYICIQLNAVYSINYLFKNKSNKVLNVLNKKRIFFFIFFRFFIKRTY